VRPSRKIQFKVPARRCLLKPPLRIKSVSTKVSEEEFAALEALARARKLTLSEWVRAELLEPRGAESGAANEVLLGEVLALAGGPGPGNLSQPTMRVPPVPRSWGPGMEASTGTGAATNYSVSVSIADTQSATFPSP